MTAAEATQALQLGNTIGLEWWVVTHPASSQLVGNITTGPAGTTISTGANWSTILLLGGIALIVFLAK